MTVVGARPQFVKAAALSRELAGRAGVREVLVHTGQHHDENMSDVFFEEMGIPRPDHHLGIHGGSHGAMTGRMLEAIEAVLQQEQPDVMLVYGDTNSTLAGGLAAAKLHVPVAHVEAGLRSFNRRMPEEINRVLTDHLATWLFAPTTTAADNLRQEGIPEDRIRLVGDVMQDAALHYSALSDERATVLERIGGGAFILATLHRAENTDDEARLRNIFAALSRISQSTRVVMPLHPRTRQKLASLNLVFPNITLLDPVGYFDMLALLKGCSLVMTDSGGLQKEAYFFARPCITLRDETEWVELVTAGANVLVGADPDKIQAAVTAMAARAVDFRGDLYGGGRAAARIADILLAHGGA
ncbi:MAG: UDP-N-acetylglucosamine 2-epimerase [Moraxellaceae bacterium]|nr:UDP-N-acetylglucosamine 2-epimerase [Moraxellaceae bacterium]